MKCSICELPRPKTLETNKFLLRSDLLNCVISALWLEIVPSQFSGINVRLNVKIRKHVVQSHVSMCNFKCGKNEKKAKKKQAMI